MDRDVRISEDNLSRLAKFIMIKYDVDLFDAFAILERFRISLICGPGIYKFQAIQAALITAINCGKRCFLGGVEVVMPENVPLLIDWPGKNILNEVVIELGAMPMTTRSSQSSFALLFGEEKNQTDSLHVICNGWVGGVSELAIDNSPTPLPDFSLGGVLAGGLGVAGAFFRVSGVRKFYGCEPVGASLWNPEKNWLSSEATGGDLAALPKRLWVLGLGHLGQAYLWSLSLLPYPRDQKLELLLQDFDIIKEANKSTGLLSEDVYIGQRKTRACAHWLERRNVVTTIVEQPFHGQTRRQNFDPGIALCGFDKDEPRRILEGAGFKMIVEAGLGASIDEFDDFVLHTFPNQEFKASGVWAFREEHPPTSVDEKLRNNFLKVTGEDSVCGVVASTLAGKAIASSFVGTVASTFVIAELLKGLHSGIRCGKLSMQLRSLPGISAIQAASLREELISNGIVVLK